MELGLTGRTVVITGGSSGIGKAVAWEYLKEGCHVAVCSRGQARLEDAVREFLGRGLLRFCPQPGCDRLPRRGALRRRSGGGLRQN
ncbi:MAG: SDR family NAD(P)-dependent oxidoreductase [Intestinimonas sp.]